MRHNTSHPSSVFNDFLDIPFLCAHTGKGIHRSLRSIIHSISYYSPGDKIHLFGFSRGAYTARALAGMIYKASYTISLCFIMLILTLGWAIAIPQRPTSRFRLHYI